MVVQSLTESLAWSGRFQSVLKDFASCFLSPEHCWTFSIMHACYTASVGLSLAEKPRLEMFVFQRTKVQGMSAASNPARLTLKLLPSSSFIDDI